MRDLLADEWCSLAVVDFLASTDLGRRVPAEEDGAVSAVSELEGLTMKQNAELEQTRKDLATAQAQTPFYQATAKELEGKMTVQLTMMQEELKASRDAYTKTVTALTKTTEANAKVRMICGRPLMRYGPAQQPHQEQDRARPHNGHAPSR